MTKELIIVGAGGHGKVAAECAELMGCFSHISFADGSYPARQNHAHWTICAHSDELEQVATANTEFFIAIGDNQVRKRMMQQVISKGLSLTTLIHPGAIISKYSQVGVGTLVCANAVINCFSTVGQGCIVNTSASIDHDCVIEEYVHLAPGSKLAGTIRVGASSFIGVGSVILPGKNIGRDCILGAGSTLLNDIPDFSLAVGSPARVIKKNN